MTNLYDEASVRHELHSSKTLLEDMTEAFYTVKEGVVKGLLGERDMEEARRVLAEASVGMNTLRKNIDDLTRQLARLTADQKVNWRSLGF